MNRKYWKKRHKWLGLGMSLIIILYSVSGIVLNHRVFFSSIGVSRSILPQTYRYKDWNGGIVRGTLQPSNEELPELLLYGASGVWAKDGDVVSDFNIGLPDGPDHRQIKAVVETSDGELFAAGQFGLYRFDKGWKSVDIGHKTNTRIADLTLKGDTLVLLSRNYLYISTSPYAKWEQVQLVAGSDYTGQVTMLKTIWELHSGAYFGLLGRLIVDAFAVVMILLSVTGILHWFFPKLLKHLKRKGKAMKRSVHQMKNNLYLHDKIGRWTVVFLLLVTFTGMLLRPPLLLTIVKERAKPIPGTSLYSSNPWKDQLRMIRYDEGRGEWLLSGSGGFYTMKSLKDMPRRIDPSPRVSVMGLNVMERLSDGRWLVGSFSGAYLWCRESGEIRDYFTNQVSLPLSGMPTFNQQAVSGYSRELNEVFLNIEGSDFAPMPNELSKLPMSLYNVMLEVHTGRIFTFLPFPDGWFAFVAGSLIIVMLVVGWSIRLTKQKK
ncbi:MAG: PepSY-associated TM helix domain-containing protein [Bacteroidales bacterium]|uniref:PepSY-associated TM helix domain-containing protein n=1 Tax=Porphyromonas sp. TaxID=1924944 RepID=UPI002978B2EA|nr:PepSY-associated TM helix domain-containing protein [Porphyromonas sp.]MDD7437339.1 PepSY-associated TM helix domain-containing protein [Bacteroidales bacterium]MDY3066670.1 PepSY-associated TM helix domain-containing protein [Porphyromonas sp.]